LVIIPKRFLFLLQSSGRDNIEPMKKLRWPLLVAIIALAAISILLISQKPKQPTADFRAGGYTS
jgi:hypothetical protein